MLWSYAQGAANAPVNSMPPKGTSSQKMHESCRYLSTQELFKRHQALGVHVRFMFLTVLRLDKLTRQELKVHLLRGYKAETPLSHVTAVRQRVAKPYRPTAKREKVPVSLGLRSSHNHLVPRVVNAYFAESEDAVAGC